MCIGGRLHGRCCIKPAEPPKPVPLSGVIVSVKITDFIAEVTVHQRYVNIENDPIEALYTFPLMEGSSVSRFYAIVGGEKIEGKIKEKEEAKDIYDDAIASGNSAYLLEQVENKENIFKTSIGNLPPHEEVVVTVVYVTELSFSSGKLSFTVPTNTEAYPDGKEVPIFYLPNYQTIKQLHGPSIPPYGLKLDVNLEMTSQITEIKSFYHPIKETKHSSFISLVSLANPDVSVPLIKDFVLEITLAEPNKPVFRVQDKVAMLAMYPDLTTQDDDDPITEMIFVVDRSGSMRGSKIASVKDTLQIFLRSLPPGTLFNIIGFGTNIQSLFTTSKEYDDATLEEATKHVETISANLGGTDLLIPLKRIFATKSREGIPRQIFVLTDGEVNNTQECIDFVRQNSDTSRVFAFGIEGASPKLVNGIAKAGEGKAELISRNENIEAKVLAQLKRALQPALTNLKIDWGNMVQEQAPFHLPPFFNGSRIIAYGYLSPNAKPGKVTFTAESIQGVYKFELEVTEDHLKPVDDAIIPKLAARSMIRDLEEGRSAFQNITEKDAKTKIIRLSIQSGMLSKYTAFVAVHENDKAVEGTMQTRDVNKLERQSSLSKAGGFGGGRGGSRMSVGATGGGPVLFRGRSSASSSSISKSISTSSSSSSSSSYSSFDVPKAISMSGGSRDGAFSKMYEEKEKKMKKKDVDRSAPPPASRSFALSRPASSSSSSSPSSFLSSSSSSSSSSPSPRSQSAPTSAIAPSGFKGIIMQQKAFGNFVEDALKTTGSITLAKLRQNAPEELRSLPQGLLDQILITVFICGILHLKYADAADQWELVEKKAIAWVKKEIKKVAETNLSSYDWNSLSSILAKLT